MRRDRLLALFHQHGLARVGDALLALAAPTIWVHAAPAVEADIPVGASKLGGQPDLPAGEAWPAWHEPMAFLAQFNLAETAPYDIEGALPARGLLSFFYETDGEPLYAELWGLPEPERSAAIPDFPDPRSWRVRYFAEDPSAFVRRPVPPSVNPGGRFPNLAARFTTEWTIPDAERWETLPLGLTGPEQLALTALAQEANGGSWEEPGVRLLGHPDHLNGSALLQCEVEKRGLRDVRWDRVTPEQERVAARWRLLLQLVGGRDVPYNWGGGVLHVCIERAALAARDFSRAWMTMQVL